MDIKSEKFVLLYQYYVPMGYNGNPLWENYVLEKLGCTQSEDIVIGEKSVLLNTFHSSLIANRLILLRHGSFMRQRFNILVSLQIEAAIAVIFDPKTKYGDDVDDSFCLGQRLEVCPSVLSVLNMPVFLLSLHNREKPREWTQLISQNCPKATDEKHSYRLEEEGTMVEDVKNFLALASNK